MTKINHGRAVAVFLAVILAAVLVPVASAKTVGANSFPGSTGAIAYATNRDGGTDANNVFRMNADGFGQTRLTETPGKNTQPAWSSDGRKLAFMNYQNGEFEIYRMNADGSDETPLTSDTADDFGPSWGSGATKLVFTSTRFNSSGDVFLMTLGATGQAVEVTRLTTYTGQDGDAALSPDGKRVAFSSHRDGDYDVYVMKAAPEGPKNRPVKITRNTADEGGIEWSPDGKQLAFTSNNNIEVYRMLAAPEGRTNRPVNLSRNSVVDNAPTWSPDGKKIAFASDRDGDLEIYRMRATDGANPVNLTNNSTLDFDPDWQPQP